jgi:hypothetical protein
MDRRLRTATDLTQDGMQFRKCSYIVRSEASPICAASIAWEMVAAVRV